VLEVALLPVAGWMAPMWLLRARARRRLGTIDYDLPELIDLLVVTVEAGVGFAASLQIAVERLPGPLGDELRLVLQEQAMGLSVNDALRNMLARCDTPAVRSFVRSILQGETLGVSIGQIMRNLATEMRKRRRATAEERAQKAPIKILFPLVFLIFPAIFVILLGPAIYSFLQAFEG
jgi:tight adherence protein C